MNSDRYSFIENLQEFVNLYNLSDKTYKLDKIYTFVKNRIALYKAASQLLTNTNDKIVFNFYTNLKIYIDNWNNITIVFFINDLVSEEKTIYNMLVSAYENIKNEVENNNIDLLREIKLQEMLKYACFE